MFELEQVLKSKLKKYQYIKKQVFSVFLLREFYLMVICLQIKFHTMTIFL